MLYGVATARRGLLMSLCCNSMHRHDSDTEHSGGGAARGAQLLTASPSVAIHAATGGWCAQLSPP